MGSGKANSWIRSAVPSVGEPVDELVGELLHPGRELGDPAGREGLGDEPAQPGVVRRVDVEQVRHQLGLALTRDTGLALGVRGLVVVGRVLGEPVVGEGLLGVGVAGDQPGLHAAGEPGLVDGRVVAEPGVGGVGVGGELPGEEVRGFGGGAGGRGAAGWSAGWCCGGGLVCHSLTVSGGGQSLSSPHGIAVCPSRNPESRLRIHPGRLRTGRQRQQLVPEALPRRQRDLQSRRSDTGRQLGREGEARLAEGDALRHRLALLLHRLGAQPVLLDLLGGGRRLVAEDMRVAVDELGDDAAGHVVDGEGGFRVLLRYTGVEDDLQQHVAQFLAEFVAVAVLDRLDEFVGLLDAVLRQALVGLLGGPRALDADPVHDLHEVEETGAGQVVGGGEQFQFRHAHAAGAREAGEAVGEGRLALARRHDHGRAAAGARVDQLLGGRGGLVDRYPGLAQIRQLRMRAVRAQHPVGRVQGLPGGPGQQAGRDTVAGGEQDDAAGGGFGTGCVHDPNVTHIADGPPSYPQAGWLRPGLSTGGGRHPSSGCRPCAGGGCPQARAAPYRYVVCCVPVAVTSRTHGVFASARPLFWTSQVP